MYYDEYLIQLNSDKMSHLLFNHIKYDVSSNYIYLKTYIILFQNIKVILWSTIYKTKGP